MKTRQGYLRSALLAGIAAAALLPASAQAQTAEAPSAREAELEARLSQLEAAVTSLRAELEATRAQGAAAIQQGGTTAAATQAQVAAMETRVAAVEARPQAPADGFRAGPTTIRIGGFIKTVATFSRWGDGDVAANSLGRDFYLPSAIPVGGVRESTDNDYSAKQTRLWANLSTDVAGHRLSAYLEGDFQTAAGTQGTERTTNGYDFALRRAYVQFDRLTVGQDWSTFQYVGALPESTDFVGTTDGTVFVREPLIRYTAPVAQGTTLAVSVENAETASQTLGSTAMVENDDDSLPDFTARLTHSGGFGEIALAGLLRQLSVDNGTLGDDATGWGLSAAGKIWLNDAHSADLRFMATYGSGAGRYIGLNFAADAIFVPGTARLLVIDNFAAMAALRIPLGGSWRSTVMGSYQHADYPGGFAPGTFNAFNESSWSAAANLFFTPARGFDLGVEYRHGVRTLVSGAEGSLDRLEFAFKYSF